MKAIMKRALLNNGEILDCMIVVECDGPAEISAVLKVLLVVYQVV